MNGTLTRIVAVIAGWLGLLTACLAAQTTVAVGAAASTPSAETDEIVVHGTRLYELRAAIVAAEDRFYARYNELNKVEDFDIECTVAAPTGTRFKQRNCLTRLQQRAQQENGREFVQMMQDQAAGLTGTPPMTDPDTAMLARYEEYKRNVLYLLKMNPELRQLVRERDAAEKRYNDERRKRLKSRLVSFE